MEATASEGTELPDEDPTLPLWKLLLEFVLNAIPSKSSMSTFSACRAKLSSESVSDVWPGVMSMSPAKSSRADRRLRWTKEECTTNLDGNVAVHKDYRARAYWKTFFYI